MKAGADKNREQLLYGILGVAVLGCVFYVYNELFGGPSTPAPAPAAVVVSAPVVKTAQATAKGVATPPGFAVGGDAPKIGKTNGQLDPTLHEEAMHVTEALVYTGNGRNIFGLGPAPAEVAMVKPVAPARPVQVAAVYTPPVATGPPPPPPIDLKFFGIATAGNGARRAFLLHGEDVFLAADGDIVQRRYKVLSIASNSIVIEDMPNNNKQTLPLQAN